MSPGPDPKLTVEQVVMIMQNATRPFWSARQFAERSDVSRPTAEKALEKAERQNKIVETSLANGSAYYLPGKEMQRIGKNTDPIKADLQGYWNDRFVGSLHRPSIIRTIHNTDLTVGDEGKFLVMGRPGNWGQYEVAASDESVGWIEPTGGEWYTAIITGNLYDKPTVPIEHIDYPDDYDLELNIGAEHRENGNLVAAGVKNYLIKPCNNALFLQDITVERLEGPGPQMNDVKTVGPPSQREKKFATKVQENPDKYLPEEQE